MIEIEHRVTFTAAIVYRPTLALTEKPGLLFPRSAGGTPQPFGVKMLFNPREAGFIA